MNDELPIQYDATPTRHKLEGSNVSAGAIPMKEATFEFFQGVAVGFTIGWCLSLAYCLVFLV